MLYVVVGRRGGGADSTGAINLTSPFAAAAAATTAVTATTAATDGASSTAGDGSGNGTSTGSSAGSGAGTVAIVEMVGYKISSLYMHVSLLQGDL